MDSPHPASNQLILYCCCLDISFILGQFLELGITAKAPKGLYQARNCPGGGRNLCNITAYITKDTEAKLPAVCYLSLQKQIYRGEDTEAKLLAVKENYLTQKSYIKQDIP